MENKHFIHQQKMLARDMESMIPAVYATIAMILYRGGLTTEDIQDICLESQAMWEANVGNITSMLIKCYNETGIQFMTPKQQEWAKKKGLIDDVQP